jgi:hypothetical protein
MEFRLDQPHEYKMPVVFPGPRNLAGEIYAVPSVNLYPNPQKKTCSDP